MRIDWFEPEDGIRVRVARRGVQSSTGRHVLLLHGFCEYLEKYEPVFEALESRGHRVTAPEFRGHGRSTRLVADRRMGYVESFDDYLRDLLRFLESLGDDAPDSILAHSMGGHMALRLLRALPDRFERAVLVSPMMGLKTPFPL